ncbi:MAG: 4-hydroxy-tetrahydrodipicolinate reductase [Planctomycetes bacterium]|nr:4-hydroxy-tetrahydrodipicolinate reductase [Planctomycetota bacterium]
MPLSFGLSGALGRMGRRIAACAADEPDLALAAAVIRPDHPAVGTPFGAVAGLPALPAGLRLAASWDGRLDCLIDFSTPAGTRAALDRCLATRTPLLVGTTGLSPDLLADLAAAGATIPVVVAPNTSVGVNVLLHLVAAATRALGPGYDAEIVEAHHREKKDAPSGTALRIAQVIAEARSLDLASDLVHGRRGAAGPRRPSEIGLHAVRGGDIVGEHTIFFSALGDRIELTHRAHSRDTFARGALRAARFLAAAPAGAHRIEVALGLA